MKLFSKLNLFIYLDISWYFDPVNIFLDNKNWDFLGWPKQCMAKKATLFLFDGDKQVFWWSDRYIRQVQLAKG